MTQIRFIEGLTTQLRRTARKSNFRGAVAHMILEQAEPEEYFYISVLFPGDVDSLPAPFSVNAQKVLAKYETEITQLFQKKGYPWKVADGTNEIIIPLAVHTIIKELALEWNVITKDSSLEQMVQRMEAHRKNEEDLFKSDLRKRTSVYQKATLRKQELESLQRQHIAKLQKELFGLFGTTKTEDLLNRLQNGESLEDVLFPKDDRS